MKISRKDSHLQGDKPEAEVAKPTQLNMTLFFGNGIIQTFRVYCFYD